MQLLLMRDVARGASLEHFQRVACDTDAKHVVAGARMRMIMDPCSVTPYLLSELLTLNHVVSHGESVTPRAFLPLSLAVLRSDWFRCGFQHRLGLALLAQKRKEFHMDDFMQHHGSLHRLYSSVLQQIHQLLITVKLDNDVTPLDFEKLRERCTAEQFFLAIEECFFKDEQLSMNSIRYFEEHLKTRRELLPVSTAQNNFYRPEQQENIILADLYCPGFPAPNKWKKGALQYNNGTEPPSLLSRPLD